MPTYQYVCTECGEPLEAVQAFSDDPLTECPACSGRLRKVFSAVGVVFKGSGFYRTDSRASTRSGGSKDTAAEASPSGSGSEGKGSSPTPAPAADGGGGSGAKPAPAGGSTTAAPAAKGTPAKGSTGKVA